MKKPHAKVQRKTVMVDPVRGRSLRTQHTIERSGYAKGGAVGYGDTKDSYLRGAGSPWSAAHKVKK